jgi:hypothetical protein
MSKEEIKETAKRKGFIDNEKSFIAQFLKSNPESWETYYWAGTLYKARNDKQRALVFFNEALTKEINDSSEIYKLKKLIKECNK